jgi:hypothetical protein
VVRQSVAIRLDGYTDPFTDRIIDDAVRKPSGEKDGESALFLGGRLLAKKDANWVRITKPARCAGLLDTEGA